MTVPPAPFVWLLWLALGSACAGPAKKEPTGPDEAALAMPTFIQAREARLVLSERFRSEMKLDGATRTSPKEGVDVIRGDARLLLRGLSIEATETIEVRWLPDHDNLMVYATGVALFKQERDRPYYSKDLAAVSVANDQVSFFK